MYGFRATSYRLDINLNWYITSCLKSLVTRVSDVYQKTVIYENKIFYRNQLKNGIRKIVFNVDETGVFLKCLSYKFTLVFKREKYLGGKYSKEWVVTLTVCSNTTEKQKLVIIEKIKKTKGFKKIKSFETNYERLLMPSDIFERVKQNS